MRFPLKFALPVVAAGLFAAAAAASEPLSLPSPVPPPATSVTPTVVSGWWVEVPEPAAAGWVPPMFGDAIFGGLSRGGPNGLFTVTVGYAEPDGQTSVELLRANWSGTSTRAKFTS